MPPPPLSLLAPELSIGCKPLARCCSDQGVTLPPPKGSRYVTAPFTYFLSAFPHTDVPILVDVTSSMSLQEPLKSSCKSENFRYELGVSFLGKVPNHCCEVKWSCWPQNMKKDSSVKLCSSTDRPLATVRASRTSGMCANIGAR